MARAGRKPRRNNDGNGAAGLINALKFVSAAQSKDGEIGEVHSVFYGGFVTAFNGLLTIGHPVEEDLNCCPNTLQLLAALLKCGEKLSITQLDSGRLSIKSDKFKALVNCARFEEMPYVGPDAPCADINDSLRTGLEYVYPLIDESESRLALQGVLVQANTVVATNGKALLEYWHGIDLPPNLLIPKVAAKAICNVGKKLTKFGFSYNSATFFYEDGSYIKTQLFDERFPNYQAVIDIPCNPWPVVEGFYAAVDALENFTESGLLYFSSSAMRSHPDESQGATYEIQGLPEDGCFNAAYLQLVRKAFVNVDFQGDKAAGYRAMFFGENVRGALMGCRFK